MSTALDQNHNYGEDVSISLTIMDVHMVMMWEFVADLVSI